MGRRRKRLKRRIRRRDVEKKRFLEYIYINHSGLDTTWGFRKEKCVQSFWPDIVIRKSENAPSSS